MATDDVMEFARVLCEAAVIVLIALEPVKNTYLNNFVKRLLPAFILEELLIFLGAVVTYMNLYTDHRIIIWRISEVIRIFISLSLCYPMSLFIGESGKKVQRLFIFVCCLMIVGTTSDLVLYHGSRSGVNYIALLLIFLFTLYQYRQLRQQIEGEIPRLNSLIILEVALIILNILLIILFFTGGPKLKFFIAFKIALNFIQLQKFYTMILVMTYFN